MGFCFSPMSIDQRKKVRSRLSTNMKVDGAIPDANIGV